MNFKSLTYREARAREGICVWYFEKNGNTIPLQCGFEKMREHDRDDSPLYVEFKPTPPKKESPDFSGQPPSVDSGFD